MHKSAHREMQDAVQDGYDRGVRDTLEGVLRWLEERKASPEFELVLIAFKADFVGEKEAE